MVLRSPALAPLIACVLLLCRPAQSAGEVDPSAQTDLRGEQIDSVEITEHRIGSGADAASQDTVGGDLLTRRPILRPAEVLEYVPGLVVTQHSGDGKANQYFLRGYNLDHGTDLAGTVDGVPVNMPTNAHGQGYMDLNFVIPELIEFLEYQKGPYDPMHGDFSDAGAVDIHYRARLPVGLVQATAGPWSYRRALAAASFPGPGGSGEASSADAGAPVLLSAVEALHENGPWTPAEGLNRVNGLLRFTDGTAVHGWSLDGLLYKAHWTSADPVPYSLIQSGQLARFTALDPTDGGDSERAIASAEWHRVGDEGSLRASAYAEHYQLQLWSDFSFFEHRCSVVPNPALPCDQFEQLDNRNLVGAELAAAGKGLVLGHKSISEVGLQVRYDDIRVGLNDTQSRAVFHLVRDDRVDETTSGLYLKNTTTWADWMRSVAGVRADRIDMTVDAQLTPQNSGTAHAERVFPKLSLIFGPWDATELFVNAGKGFHSNDARGVTQRLDPTTGTAAVPVPVLASAKGAEIGARTESIQGLRSSLVLWLLASDSEVQYNADSDIGSTTPNGASKRRGIEWANQWSVMPWLLLDADLAWTHARYAHENDNGARGDRIPNAIGTVATLGITVMRGRWSGALTTRYFGPYPLTQDESLTGPTSFTTNMRIQYKPLPHVSVGLDMLNLFDRKNLDIAYAQDLRASPMSPIEPSAMTVHPAEPLQIRATLAFEL